MLAPSRRKNLFLLALASASFLTPFIAIAVNIALPSMATAFNIDVAIANWVANSFLISMASTILLVGAVADWIGKELIFISGSMVFVITSFLIPYTNNFSFLIFLRCIQGLGAAMISGTAVAILTSIFPEKAGFVIGLNTAAVYTGTTLGPILGGFLIDHAGWPSLFMFVGSVALVSFALTLPFVEFAKKDFGRKPYFQTLSIFSVSIALVIIGSTYVNSLYGILELSLGLIMLTSTLYIEFKRSLNLVKEIFERGIFLAYMTTLLSYTSTYALSILFSNFLQIEGGFRAREVGLILLAQLLPQMLLSPIAGYLTKKIDPNLLAAIGMILIALGIGSSTIIYKFLSLLVVSLILIGIGFALFASPNTTRIMLGVPKQAFASAASFLGLMRFLGQSLSTSILTVLMLTLKPFIYSMEIALIIYTFTATCGAAAAMLSKYSS
ncbi:MAG: MFS transporter [Candidatus Bathyarchaeia archaeon]